MNAAREEVRMVHFTVDADWLTDLVRSLWADEGEVEKAYNILDAAFPTMDRETMTAILSGSKKLTGNSDGEGMRLEDDDTKRSRCGNTLDPKDVYARMQRRTRKVEADLRDMTDMATGNTVLLGSPKGAVRVPRNRTVAMGTDPLGRGRKRLRDGVELEDIPHEECRNLFRGPYTPIPAAEVKRRTRAVAKKLTAKERADAAARVKIGLDYEALLGRSPSEQDSAFIEALEEEDTPEPPPTPEPKITSDTGWLSPNGEFYPCEYSGHVGLASRLGFDEPRLEKMGWIKMQTGKFFWDFLGHFKATQKQIDAIFDWTQSRGEKMPSLGWDDE